MKLIPSSESEWKQVVPRLRELTDLVHYTGAVRMASVVAWLAAGVLFAAGSDDFSLLRFTSMNLVGAFLFLMHCGNYRQSRLLAQRSVQHALGTLLGARSEDQPYAVTLVIDPHKSEWRGEINIQTFLGHPFTATGRVFRSIWAQLRHDPEDEWPTPQGAPIVPELDKNPVIERSRE